MPICENKIKGPPIDTEPNQLDEAAKVKKTLEQAYFNSYDFDAIEVLPSSDEDIHNQVTSSPVTSNLPENSHTSSAIRNVYLKRLTSYFSPSNKHRKSAKKRSNSNNGDGGHGELQSNSSSSSTADSSSNLYGSSRKELEDNNSRNNFLLPRAMLKYQGSLTGNSMPTALVNVDASIDKVHNVSTSSEINPKNQCKKLCTGNSGLTRCFEKNERDRGILSSHYSTDKSGSSGYYSSNICSTSSVEDHIYSEPVVETLDPGIHKRNSHRRFQVKAEICNSNNAPVNDLDKDLRLLETSIENLDRHLKSYPRITLNEKCNVPNCFHHCEKGKNSQLPTIMEGIDLQSNKKIANLWSDDLDDSLVDIDLDSFLIDREMNKKEPIKGSELKGIDNPTFDKSKMLDDKYLENNYRCSKYVNSCPDNAYNVESVLDSEIGNKSVAFFLKKYEDQMHFQCTKEMLEEIRDKLRSLAESTGSGERILPKEVENNIASLKIELETYLKLMNRCSEMEIKHFCAGVLNNQKLLAITKAFDRRKSLGSETEYELTYEPIRPRDGAIQFTDSLEVGSVRCSDPNFKLKRKPLSDAFPININEDVIDDHISKSCDENSTGNRTSASTTSQLQRNLSLQRHKLIKSVKTEDDRDSMLEWHKNKPSIWELYYGTNRINQTLAGKRGQLVKHAASLMSYPSSRPESDFTLDLPKAEQLRLKMEKEKRFRHRCRILTTFLSFVFFLLTVMVVSLVLTRGKRMFGSML